MKKGIAILEGMLLFVGVTAVFALASDTMRSPDRFSSFRAKKAVEVCQGKGESNCSELIKNMSTGEIFEYIQDK